MQHVGKKVTFISVLVICFRYYAVCFLNQLILSHDEPDLATKLIIVYFSFFKVSGKFSPIYHRLTLTLNLLNLLCGYAGEYESMSFVVTCLSSK